MNNSLRRARTTQSQLEAVKMFIKRSTLFALLGSLLIANACTSAQDTVQSETPSRQAAPEKEMVEIVIRMPDGRVIVRKERKLPSRINSDELIVLGKRPPVIKSTKHKRSSGTTNTLSASIVGGSNGSSGTMKTAGGGGGGGGASASSGGGGGGGGGQSNATGGSGQGPGSGGGGNSNSQLDNDFTNRIYAWGNQGAPFQHTIFNYVAYPANRFPLQLAQTIATQIEVDQPEKVVIRFWDEFSPAQREPFDISNPTELLQTGGYTEGLAAYWGAFASELEQLGIKPDYLVFDVEDGIDFVNIPAQSRRAFFEELMDPQSPVRNLLPASMQNVTLDQFMDPQDPQGNMAVDDYNDFAASFRADLLRRIFSQSFDTVYGEHIPISNYNDMDPTFGLTRFTNRPVRSATVGGISAPSSYVYEAPDWGRYRFVEKDIRWNRLIDILNLARSAAGNGLVTPWISAPGYGRYGHNTWARASEMTAEFRVWEVLMSHFNAMGIDTFILWNPSSRFNPNAIESNALVDQWLAQHPSVAGPQLQSLPEIQLDADFIETNGVITYYQDFLDAMNNI